MVAYADNNLQFYNIVNAIYKAEGGDKAQFAYGIRSVKYKSVSEARKICYNTVSNNYLRWKKAKTKEDFLEYLSKVYCPFDHEVWLKNVRYFLDKSK